MRATLNKVTIVGEVGQEPETGISPGSDDAVALLHILTGLAGGATPAGARAATAESHRVILLGTLAQAAAATVQRGATVYVEGRLTTRRYMAHDGQVVEITEVLADRLCVIGGGKTLLAAHLPVDDASGMQTPGASGDGAATAHGACPPQATIPKRASRPVRAAAARHARWPAAPTARRR